MSHDTKIISFIDKIGINTQSISTNAGVINANTNSIGKIQDRIESHDTKIRSNSQKINELDEDIATQQSMY